MQLDPKRRTGPASHGTGSKEIIAADDSGVILPLPSAALADLDALAAHVDGAFVVVVKVTGDHYRRRCYLTAKAAENAARRATERGENATVYMAELKPLWRIVGGREAAS